MDIKGKIKAAIMQPDKEETFELDGTNNYFPQNHAKYLKRKKEVTIPGKVVKNKGGYSEWRVETIKGEPMGYFFREAEAFYNENRLQIANIELTLKKVGDFRVCDITFYYK